MAFVDGENGENFMSEILGLSQFGKSDTRKQVKDLNKFGMNYEQRYKEALERMKSWVKGEHPDCFSEAQKAAEFIFPELAESEDEKIRKSLIRFLKSPFVNENIADEKVDPWIAWLEKQVEQESVDKIEPKFKVGDWIVSNNDGEVWQIGSIYYVTGQCCYLYNKNRDSICVTKEELNNDYHLFTIADAKNGDVLASGRTIVIVKHKHNNTSSFDSACAYIGEDDSFISCTQYCYRAYGSSWHPATKEQRDLLFQKMKDAGYEWDSEKKELRKIDAYQLSENPCSNCTNTKGCITCVNGDQKSTSTPRILYSDDVIKWIDEHVPTKFEDMQNYVKNFKQHFEIC